MNIRLLRERIRRHGLNAGCAVAEQGAAPALNILLTPLLLERLGREQFGIWALALTLISMSQLVSCGASVATTKHVSADLGAGAIDAAIASVRAALTIAMTGGAAAIVLAWLLGPLVARIIFHRMGAPGTLGAVLLTCAIGAAVQEMDAVFAAALRGAQRFDLSARVEGLGRVLVGAGLICLSFLTSNALCLLTGLVALMTVKVVLKALQVRVLFRRSDCCYPSCAMEPLRRVLRFGCPQWFQATGTVLFTAADQVLVGSLLGGAALARYSVCLQIAQYVHMLPGVMMQVIFPRISSFGGAIDAERGNEILRSATRIAVGTALALGLPLIAFARPLLAVWIGRDFAVENASLLGVLVSAHIALSFNVAAYYVLLGAGKVVRSAAITIAAGTAQVLLSATVAPWGLMAVGWSRFCYPCITALLYRAARFEAAEWRGERVGDAG